MNLSERNSMASKLNALLIGLMVLLLLHAALGCKQRNVEVIISSKQELPGAFGGELFFKWGTRKTELVRAMLSRENIRTDSQHEKTFVTPELHFKGGSLYGMRVASWAFAFGDSVRADSVNSIGLYFAQVIFEGSEKIDENFKELDNLICTQYGLQSALTESTGKVTYRFLDGDEIILAIIKIGKKPPTISLEYLNQKRLDEGVALAEKLKARAN
jgi:hypothetical protein